MNTFVMFTTKLTLKLVGFVTVALAVVNGALSDSPFAFAGLNHEGQVQRNTKRDQSTYLKNEA